MNDAQQPSGPAGQPAATTASASATAPATAPATASATIGGTAAAPGYRRFETIGEYWSAFDTVLALARREVFLFDIALDSNFDRPHRSDLLRTLLAAHPDNRLRIVLHDAHSLARECPRLCRLMRQFSQSVSIGQTTQAARSAADPLIVVDSVHALRRFHHTQPRSSLITDDPAATRPLLYRLEQIQEASEPLPPAAVLGL